MKIHRDGRGLDATGPQRAIALGTFDGVHLGHRRVIAAAVEHASQSGLVACVVTFEPHPARVLHPEDPPELLSTFDIKAERIGELGVAELIAIPFTLDFSRMSASQFCTEVLIDALDAKYVSAGANFRFGHGAQGDTSTLAARPEFETEAVALVELGGAPVSSTRIRELIQRGDVREAAELLGDPFAIEGSVVTGQERGRKLQVPTANIDPSQGLVLPAAGVYAASARAKGRDIPAAVNVGVRPTFEADGDLVVEAHLIDFDADLYGQTLRVSFLERLRDEVKFDSADELVAQIQRDVEASREVARAATETAHTR